MSQPPDPYGVSTVEELIVRLRMLRAWSGLTYRAVHRQVVRRRVGRGIPEQPVYNTVYRAFQPGRSRLDVDLVVDIAAVLLGADRPAEQWRQACQLVAEQAGPAHVVEVTAGLRPDPGDFVGRRAELQALLADPAPVTVIAGMPGVGKTRLAITAGHQLVAAGRCTDLQLSVDLCGFDPHRSPADPDAVLDEFLRCLGVPGDEIARLDRDGAVTRYRSLIQGRAALIVLDNAFSVEQVTPLLPGSDACITLITSRRTLEMPAARLTLDVFTPVEAGELLRLDDEPDIAARIATLLGHLPLALALAAAWFRDKPAWTAADHAERIEQHHRRLQLEDGVTTALDLSYQDLAPDLRQMLLSVATHPGEAIDSDSAAALVAVDRRTARDRLEQLVEGSLLQRHGDRYRLHDLVRMYAIARGHEELPASSRRAAQDRLLDYYADRAAYVMGHYTRTRPDGHVVPDVTDQASAVRWLTSERANLVAAIRTADRPDYVRTQSALLWPFLFNAGYYRDIEMLYSLVLTSAAGSERSRALAQYGAVLFELGSIESAAEHFRQALDLAEQHGDLRNQRRAANGLGNCHWVLGSYDDAIASHRQALDIGRQLGDRQAIGRSLGNLAGVFVNLGRYAEAEAHYRDGLAIALDLGDLVHQASALGNIAVLYELAGRWEDSITICREVLELCRRSGDRAMESLALNCLAGSIRRVGRPADAIEYFQRALTLSRELGQAAAECSHMNGLAETYRALHRHDEAIALHEQALRGAAGRPRQRVHVQNSYAETLHSAGRSGLELHRVALAAAEELADLYEQARAHAGIARSGGGDEHRRRAGELFGQLGVPPHVP